MDPSAGSARFWCSCDDPAGADRESDGLNLADMVKTAQMGLGPASFTGVSPAKQGLAGGILGRWHEVGAKCYSTILGSMYGVCTSTECMLMVLLSVINHDEQLGGL